GILYFGFEYWLTKYFEKLWQKIFLSDLIKINMLIENYNKKLNSMIKRNEIQEQLAFLFSQAFGKSFWAIYWIKGNYFEKISQSNRINNTIPAQIEINKDKYLRELKNNQEDYFLLIDILARELELKKSFEDLVNENKFKYVIPIKSYHNMVGLILFDASFEKYLEFRKLKSNFIKIINKTSEMAEKAELYDEVELQYQYNEKLLEVNKIITSSLNLNDVLNGIMGAVSRFVKSDAETIFLVDDLSHELKHQYLRGYDESEIKNLHIKKDQGIVGKAIESGIAYNIPDVRNNNDYCELRKSTKSQLTIPLYSGEKSIGAIALESDKLNHFTGQDMAILKTFAGHASIAINNAWLYKNVIEKKRMESDLLNASQVQQSLLLKRVPQIKGISLSISNIPCKLVGGDFYDVQKLSDEKFIVGIGDVSGKGAPGALLMAVVMAGLRSFYKQVYSACEIVARLNNLMAEATTSSYYATMFLAMINVKKSEITFTNAGHNPPVIIRKKGAAEQLSGGGIVVGFRKEIEYRLFTKPLNEGDIIFLYTDGLEEAQNSL
ncbi:MAG: SpoIIE family protein phosphatase, partial [Calditrichia bacterium]|nr:SpoIIE family protein phosphatase [Calditrichia bacterium]